jgi:DNA polymerase-3 subunit alpha
MNTENKVIEEDKIVYTDYVSLHNYTTYSIFNSLISPQDLFKHAAALGQKAVAVTDLFSAAGFHDSLKAAKATGVKLIAGCTFCFVDNVADKEAKIRYIVLLAKNAIGYRNLLLLNNYGYNNSILARKTVFPRIDWAALEEYKEGLICITGCSNGIISRLLNDKKFEKAEKQAIKLKELFGDDLGLEVQPNALRRAYNNFNQDTDQMFVNRQLKKLGEKLDIKLIPATEARYNTAEQFDALDVWLAIGSGQPRYSNNRLKFNVNDFYIKNGNEVKEFFSRIWGEEFACKLLENTIYFADKCEEPIWIDPKYSNPSGNELAEFPVKDQVDYQEFLKWKENCAENTLDDEKLYLRYWCYNSLEKLFDSGKLPREVYDEYSERLKEELDVLEFQNFSGYMLVVADYVQYAKNNGISVGPGRGSVGGSLIGYLLNIHLADPIKYDLVFARFHNKEKVSAPDIDLDYATSTRHLIEEYLIKKYGADRVAQISNFNTLTPKPYVKAIARTFEYGGGRKESVAVGNALAETIPNEAKTVANVFDYAPLLKEYAETQYPELKTFSRALGKNPVAVSTHAGGIIVARRSLPGLIPLRRDKEGNQIVEFEKERAEENGLIKMDILGVSTLDIIDTTYDLIKKAGKPAPDFNYETYDKKAYDLIASGNTFGVFQFGTSGGTVDLCKKFNAKSIEDLALITTLARPAAKNIRNEFFEVKNGLKPITLLHPLLERAFKKTLGFPLFDESLLILANDVAKWDLAEADSLRKLTKLKGKYPAKVKKWKEDFIDNAFDRNNVDKEISKDIWEKIIEPFGTYSFNKSHAILYSYISYHTAFLKAHYPLEFLTSNLKSEVASNAKTAKDNIVKIKEEIKKFNIKIIAPDINKSDRTYTIVDENTLVSGLSSLRYVSNDAIDEILTRREEKPFDNFEDFLTRCNSSTVRSNAVQALAATNSLTFETKLNRRQMFLYCADYKKKLQAWLKKKPEKRGLFKYDWPEEKEWTVSELYALEVYYLNEGLTGTAFEVYPGFFKKDCPNFAKFHKLLPKPSEEMNESDLKKYTKRVSNIQGIVKSKFEITIKKPESKLFGEKLHKMIIEDPYGNQIGVTFFPDGWANFNERILERDKKQKFEFGMSIEFVGNLQWYADKISIIYEKLQSCAAPPQFPADMKVKKSISTRKKAENSESEDISINKDEVDRNELLEEIEEELIEEGFSDLDDDLEE